MSTLRICMVVFIGVCCLPGCSATTRGPRANVVRPLDDVSYTHAAPVEDRHEEESETGAARKAIRQPTLCDGETIERVEERWADGTLRLLQEVVVGEDETQIPHGLRTTFWENGKKKSEMGYNCGIQDGPRMTWFENGQPWSSGEYANGKEHGLWTAWYTTGAKAREFTMVHGAWHGTQTYWYPDGREQMVVEWVDGQRQGPVRAWDSEGNLVTRQDYVDNIAQPTPAPLARLGP